MIRALMVDVDGVLIRGRPSDGRPWASDIEADLGLKAVDLHRAFFVPHWDDVVVGRVDLATVLIPALAMIAPNLTYDRFVAYWFENDARLDTALLGELAQRRRLGTRIYLATNQEHQRASFLTTRLGLRSHIDGIFYSAAMGCRKPDPAFFEKAARLAGLKASELLLIDDTAANVVAARRAGWAAIEWRDGSSLTTQLARSGFQLSSANRD